MSITQSNASTANVKSWSRPAVSLFGCLCVCIWTAAAPPASAKPLNTVAANNTTTDPVDRVEEDWEVVIASPDADTAGPQITTMMSPVADNSVSFLAFNLNYRDSPFRAGGLQIQAWKDDYLVRMEADETSLCQTPQEQITWTQVMSLEQDSKLHYAIVNGQSTTWGTFGGVQKLAISYGEDLSSLDSYNADTSVTSSGVTWQSNRVQSMKLLQVRYYNNGTLVRTDSTPRTVTLDKDASVTNP